MSKPLTRTCKAPPPTRRAVRAVRNAPIPPAAPASGAAPAETLREQADRLGLLDPLEEEPTNVFIADESSE
jgi:hypothetical protein